MKHLFTFLLVAISAACFAQGNLQFNQIVQSDFSGTTNITGTIVVPVNRVWKVEHAGGLLNFTLPSVPGGTSDFISIGNFTVWISADRGSADLPLWLGPGSYTVNGRFNSSTPASLSISAIEFNVVP
ncbi:hypothetical protein OAE93_01800 [bacterium]|nr:hypothetical protein [bacterium]